MSRNALARLSPWISTLSRWLAEVGISARSENALKNFSRLTSSEAPGVPIAASTTLSASAIAASRVCDGTSLVKRASSRRSRSARMPTTSTPRPAVPGASGATGTRSTVRRA
jgi:hypothetical protein